MNQIKNNILNILIIDKAIESLYSTLPHDEMANELPHFPNYPSSNKTYQLPALLNLCSH